MPERPHKRPRTVSLPEHQGGTIASIPAPPSAAPPPTTTITQHEATHHSRPSTSTRAQQPNGLGLRLKPRPTKPLPLPTQPLIQVGTRIYFAMFDLPLPAPSTLNAHNGTRCAIFHGRAPKSAGINATPAQPLSYTPAILRSSSKAHGTAPPAPQATAQGSGPKGWAPRTIQSKFHWFTVDRKNKKSQVGGDTVPNDFQHLSF